MTLTQPLFFALLLVLFALQTSAQNLQDKKIASLSLTDSVIATAIDRPGDFYVITREGQIQRFDKDGKLDLLYKAPENPTLFDPRDGARLFFYFRSDQHYEFRSPSLEPLATWQIDPAFAIQPWLICPSGEYKLWILDQADQSLKKVNVKEAEVEVEVIIDSAVIEDATSFITMREYQNYIFLLNPDKGIYIFNSLGRHIKTIDVPGIRRFNFLGEEIYYIRDGDISFFNLFTTEIRHLRVDPSYTDVLLTDERLILFAAEKIDIFSFQP